MAAPPQGDLVDWRSPQTRREHTAWIGMVVFLGSWAVLFGALLMGWAALRARATAWPPPGTPPLPIGLSAANTVILAASSAALQAGIGLLRRTRARAVGPLLLAAAVLGTLFLGGQVLTWQRVHEAGLRASSGPYGSVFYALTWFHAAHVLVGLVALGWLARRALAGAYSAPRHLPVRLWAMYWHFVGVVWLVIFSAVYFI